MSDFPTFEQMEAAIGHRCLTCGRATFGASLETATDEVWEGAYIQRVPVGPTWITLSPCQHTIDTAAAWARFACES